MQQQRVRWLRSKPWFKKIRDNFQQSVHTLLHCYVEPKMAMSHNPNDTPPEKLRWATTKNRPYVPLYSLFNKDPYTRLLESPRSWVVLLSWPRNAKQPGVFHCSPENWAFLEKQIPIRHYDFYRVHASFPGTCTSCLFLNQISLKKISLLCQIESFFPRKFRVKTLKPALLVHDLGKKYQNRQTWNVSQNFQGVDGS